MMRRHRFLRLTFAACALFCGALVAESVDAGAPGLLEKLKAENDALRRENQMLRRELVARGGRRDEAVPKTVVDTPEPAQNTQPDTGWWLSNSSHIRHNRKCRNYQKVKGRPCGPNDGRPCKSCGG